MKIKICANICNGSVQSNDSAISGCFYILKFELSNLNHNNRLSHKFEKDFSEV